MILRPSVAILGLLAALSEAAVGNAGPAKAHKLDKRQTAAAFPPLVYSTNFGTGSVDPSLQAAAVTAGNPAQAILSSQATDTATNMVPGFAPTTTREDTILPLATTGSFLFTSGSPFAVESSNTRPEYTATGTINLAQESNLATSSRSAAISSRPIKGEQYIAVCGTLIVGLASLSVILL